ncbi:MAG: glycosyltransferase family 2 protein [Anaerolineae bacterium]
MDHVDVGVVIVNWNTRDLLQRCLESVLSNTDVSFEVCVVDNDSSDGSADMVASVFPHVKLIRNDRNVGYPAANNQGLRYLGFGTQGRSAGVRYALLLNPDTELPADALAKVIDFADEHPESGVVGPKLVLQDGSLDLACRRSFPTPAISFYRITGLARLFPRSRRFGRYNLTYLDENETAEVDAVVGAFMLVRREAIEESGLLDESFFMYGEDLDWAYRMKAAGWRVYYYPEVEVLHIKRASSRQNPRARLEFWRAMDIFYRKHYAEQTPFVVHALIVAVLRLQTRLIRWRMALQA